MQAELILYALIAGGLVFWLRNIVGTRHGEERERPNPFTASPPEKKQGDAQNALDGSRDEARSDEAASYVTAAASGGLGLPGDRGTDFTLPRNVSVAGEHVYAELLALSRADRDFDLTQFLSGAQDAFAIIVEAFAEGDRETLRNLLTDSVYFAFDGAIRDREARGETVSTEIHAVRRMEILSARLEDRLAYITIRFVADETCVVRDVDSAILSGDPDRITEMNDIWTFVREVKSRDPRWLLQETRDGDVKEETRTPLPDA